MYVYHCISIIVDIPQEIRKAVIFPCPMVEGTHH